MRRLGCRLESSHEGPDEKDKRNRSEDGIAEHGRYHRGHRRDRVETQPGIDFFLGEIPQERWQAEHRDGCKGRADEADRQLVPQSTQFGDVARARAVIERAGDEKETGLVERMRDEIGRNRHRTGLRANPEHEHQHSQRRDSALRKHLFEVGLLEGEEGTPQQGGAPEDAQHALPQGRATQDRAHPGQQIDAGLHHGGRVQVGRDGRRRLHGVGQPEMERHLRRFGESRDHDEAEHPRVGPDRRVETGRRAKRRDVPGP